MAPSPVRNVMVFVSNDHLIDKRTSDLDLIACIPEGTAVTALATSLRVIWLAAASFETNFTFEGRRRFKYLSTIAAHPPGTSLQT